jgi:ABC-type glycerol-3-phosphate transport system substrate-binding protein
MGIFSGSPHQVQAWQFIRHLFEPSVQQRLYQAGLDTQDAYLPPNMASWDALPMDEQMKEILRRQAQDAKGPPAVVGWTETTNRLEAAIQQVILKGADPKTALETANQAMNEALRQ